MKKLNRGKGGYSSTSEYKTWIGMIYRCYRESDRKYPLYGGRGITVCDAWKEDFHAFFRDMGPRPPKLSIDRIDSNGNYEPSNCRWADITTQNRNRRNTVRATLNGETKTLTEWAEILQVPYPRLKERISAGWTHERALTEPFVPCGHLSRMSAAWEATRRKRVANLA